MSKEDKYIAAFLAFSLITLLTQSILLLINPYMGMVYAFMCNNWMDFYKVTDKRYPIIMLYNYALLAGLIVALIKIKRSK
jgi:hypothetical protein